MAETPTTHASLLIKLRDGSDEESWSVFVDIYAPLINAHLQRRGCQDADAADLTQDVLVSVANSINSFDYDPSASSFRHWLFTIVENRLRNFWRCPNIGGRGAGGTEAIEFLTLQPQSEDSRCQQWELSCERRLFQVAANQVRDGFSEASWLAFWRTAVDGRSGREVATELGISVAAVYMAKRRVLARIKDRVRYLQGDSE